MLQAFCDESGIHDGARFCVVAGYVGSARHWERFEKLWSPYAHKPGFHAKSFFARDPQGHRVKPYQGWNEAQGTEYLNDLLRAITSINIYPVGGIVDVEAFKKYSKDERAHLTGSDRFYRKKQSLTGAPSKPYYLAFQEAIATALHRLKRADWQVHYTFDQQREFAPLALKMYQYFKENTPKVTHKMGDAIFASRYDAIGLQAADLLAYCWYQYVLDESSVSPDIHKVLKSQKDKGISFFNKEMMDDLFKKVRAV